MPERERTLARGPIAIIGMACRFPGADTPAAFWQNLADGLDFVREIPAERWDWQSVFGDPAREANKTNSKWGGFIEGIDQFDPLFFKMSPAEANFIDPQHRLFLETAWRAIEDAGYRMQDLSGRAIGVYAGVSKNDYAEMLGDDLPSFVSTGTVHSILANRVSFLLNLRGPSMPIDTACSSALVALHYAMRDLQDGTCEAALVGGVNALLSPRMYVSHAKSGMLSPDGHCKTFDAAADGYVRGEGVGVVLLKPLADALRDGDRIHGVIRATAINHGGRANFLTAPNAAAQSDVVVQALRAAEIDPATIRYVEAHGTGTPLGDPIEIEGLKQAFATRSDELGVPAVVGHCALGSVKTNIGHLESAAGMAGLIKAIQVVGQRQIPRSLHFNRLNPLIDIDGSPFVIAGEGSPDDGKEDDTPWRAGLSGFGMGGVNAHVIVEAAPEIPGQASSEAAVRPFLFSARKGRLRALLEEYRVFLQGPQADALSAADLAFTLAVGRDAYEERCAFLAETLAALVDQIAAFLDGTPSPHSFADDAGLHADAETAISDFADPVAVARAWMQGGTVTAERRHLPGRPVSLPGHPFMRRSCWFRPFAANMEAPSPSAATVSITIAAEDPEFSDHRVQGLRHLPAVAYLRRVANHAGGGHPLMIRDVYWPQPLTIPEGASQGLLDLTFGMPGGAFRFHGDGEHCRGILQRDAAPETVSIAALPEIGQGAAGLTGREIYPLLTRHGLDYGPGFRTIADIRFAEDCATARLEHTGQAHITGLWDAAFQAAALLSIHNGAATQRQFVPFHLEQMQVQGDLATLARIDVQQQGGAGGGDVLRFDIACYDAAGQRLAVFRNFAKRAYGQPLARAAVPADILPLHLYRFGWTQAPVPAGPTDLPPLLINAPAAFHSGLSESFDTQLHNILLGETAGHALLQTILQSPAWEQRPWLIFAQAPGTADAQVVLSLIQSIIAARPRQTVRLKYLGYAETAAGLAAIQAMAGLARTAAIENPRIAIDSVVFRQPMTVTELYAEATIPTAVLHSVAYHAGERLERMAEAVQPADETAMLPVRQGGVWVIAGGAGGLGRIIAPWLARECAARLVLVGRRPEDETIRSFLEALAALGGTACYRQADCSDAAQVDALMEEVRQCFGAVHAVVHATGLIEDSFLLRKQPDSLARVLAAKIPVAVNLDAATRLDALELFLCVSSVAALMPNSGQGDYAMANTFLDHFMLERAALVAAGERAGVSLSLNLPLLAEGGITVGPREESQLWDEFGMRPLPSEAALRLCAAAMRLAAAGQHAQILGIAGDRGKIDRHLKVTLSAEQEAGLDGWLMRDLSVVLAEQFHQSPDRIKFDTALPDLGMDSIAITQIAERLNQLWGFRPNPVLFFQADTPQRLLASLIARHREALEQSCARLGAAGRLHRSHALIDPDRSEPAAGLFRRRFTNQEFYMLDHVVEGLFNVPGACYLEMARQAGAWFRPDRAVTDIADTIWVRQLSSAGPAFDACIQLRRQGERDDYEIYSVDTQGNKIVHATGALRYGESGAPPADLPLTAIRARCPLRRSRAEVYTQIHAEGLHVGPSFMPMTDVVLSQTEALAQLHLPDPITASWDDYLLHPTLLTGMFQTALIHNRFQASDAGEFIPMAVGSLRIYAPVPHDCHVHSLRRGGNAGGDVVKFDLAVSDDAGRVVLTMRDLTIKARKMVSVTMPKVETVRGASRDDVMLRLKDCVAPILGLAPREIDSWTLFKDYGVNSLMIIDLNRQMESVFGAGLSRTIFFECQSIAELADYMLAEHDNALAAAMPQTNHPIAGPTPPVTPVIARPVSRPSDLRPAHELGDIAIIGMALRFPKADTPDAFWQLLAEGRDCIERMPAGRPASAGAPWGGYLDGVDQFDPLFFNITPREAAQIDPQERLFLQTSWHALEDSGYTRAALAQSRVGVFVGALWQPYLELGIQARAAGHAVAPSSLLYSIANRVSYVCDFHGPSMAVDTACSSSLTALHLACQSLRAGESDIALAGGVNLSLGAAKPLFLGQNGFLSTDGRCRSFGEGGDGYVPGEGVAAVLLQPLAAAQAAGRQVHGVIRGTAVNHGGRTHGYTVPNPRAQAALIRETLDRAAVDPRTVSYLEAHGTGTELGDPIEINALAEAFRGSEHGSGGTCAIGSVKSNFGHLEAAAGLAGLIKVLLQMRHKVLAPSLHSATTNPHIDFTRTPFQVQQNCAPWQQPVVDGVVQPRRAGVSSFGAGGSNSHVILEEAPATVAFALPPGQVIVPLSARDEERLHDVAQALLSALGGLASDDLPRLAYTLQLGREAFETRATFLVSSLEELRDQLSAFLARPPRSSAAPDASGASHPLLQLLRRDGEMAQLVAQWIGAGALAKLADAWRLGLDVDWSLLWPQPPAILSLPGYPFAKERHWLPEGDGPLAAAVPGRLHRLLHQNVSRPGRQRYRSVFRPGDAVFADHVVQGQGLLPGAAYLEMTYAAASDSRPPTPRECIVLSDIRWLRPCVMAAEGVTLHVAILPNAEDATAAFEIHGLEKDAEVLLCRGILTWRPAQATSLLPQPIQRGDRQGAAECYRIFGRHGLAYGPSHQGIDWVEAEGDALVVGLRRSMPSAETMMPGVLDAAFQATLLPLFQADPAATPALPMAVAQVAVHRPLQDAAFAHIRPAADGRSGVDIDIAAETGAILVSLRGFETRQPASSVMTPAASDAPLLLPLWQEVPAPAPHPEPDRLMRQRLWVIDGTAALQQWATLQFASAAVMTFDAEGSAAEGIDGLAPDHILWEITAAAPFGKSQAWPSSRRVLRIVQALLQQGLGSRRIEWTVLIRDDAGLSGPADPDCAALVALLRTVTAEHPRWSMRIIQLHPQRAVPETVLHLPSEPQAQPWRLDHDAWFRPSLVPLARPEAFAGMPTGLRKGGVYIVIGGAGGIGRVWSEDAIRRYQARIVWVGRRAVSEPIQAEIDRLGAIGPAPRYVTADATDAEALAALRRQVTGWYGAVHGVIHSALVLDDARIETLTMPQFETVMAAKAGACNAIRQAFDAAPPELVLFFSSINAFAAPAGQGNYAAACCYADAFAVQLAAAWTGTVVKTINWGFWGGVGVVSTPAYRERMARLGFGSIEPAEGLAALDMLLRSPYPQLGFVKSQPGEAARAAFFASSLVGPVTSGQSIETGPPIPIATFPPAPPLEMAADEALNRLRGTVAAFLGVPPGEIDAHGRLADYGMDAADLARLKERVAATLGLSPAGFAWSSDTSLSVIASSLKTSALTPDTEAEEMTALSRRLVRATLREAGLWEALPSAAPAYLARWLTATRAFLNDLDDEPAPPLWAGWAALPALNDALTGLASRGAAYGHLLRQTLPALIDILRGTRRATDVLFPGGALHEVELVYRHNQVAQALNRRVAEAVVQRLRQQRRAEPKRPLRILEIGAGTGATSVAVFEAMDAAGLAPDRYLFTDKSPAFLIAAKDKYGLGRPWLQTAHLDIETDPWEQTLMAPTDFDMVIATNVLHATRDIRRTIRHAKAFLRPGGVLLLHELTRADWLNHATFGLLAGWWDFVDELRLPGSPLLSVDGWQELLAQTGFRDIGRLGVDHADIGQTVMIAVSDGAVLRTVTEKAAVAPLPAPRRQIAAAPEPVRPDGILDTVRRLVAEVTRIDAARLRVKDSFEVYGVDSIVRLSLHAELERHFGDLPATLLFERPSIAEVASYLAEHRALAAPPVVTTAEEVMPQPVAALAAPASTSALPPDAIAIIGMSGRYPRAPNLDVLWQRLVAGENCATPVPAGRWGRADAPVYGGFLADVDRFDHALFRLSYAEAQALAPEVRLFLETAWETFESAGYGPLRLKQMQAGTGGGTGVFVASMYHQSPLMVAETADAPDGNVTDWMIANRVSHSFDLTGPSIAINTACSGSLTALHLACESLRAGSCGMALAGGVNLTLAESKYDFLRTLGLLSEGDASRSFGRGDGFLPGEGVGAVLLKPLAQAIADQDRIEAVIRGSHVSHAGGRLSFYAPDPQAQARLITGALQRAGVAADSISYVDAAANGSELADALEVIALTEGLGASRRAQPCAIGAVKSNLGHLEAASGVSQVAKVVLQLRHATLVPSLFATPRNAHIRLDGSGLAVQESLAPWPVARDSQGSTVPRRALVNSFGAGGAYAALVLEDHVPLESQHALDTGPWLFIFSAPDVARLRRRLEQMRGFVATELQERDLPRLAATLRGLDADFPVRMAFIAQSNASLASAIEQGLALPGAVGLLHGDTARAGDLVVQAEAWLAGAAIAIGTRLKPIRLPPYPFNHDVCFAPHTQEAQEEKGEEDLFSRILTGALTEDEFALMVQS